MTEETNEKEKMHTIKFSHLYEKMPMGYFTMDEMHTTLIQTLVAYSGELTSEFIDYDTLIAEGEGDQHYELPKGKVIILFLLTTNNRNGIPELWTTIRRYTPEKWQYYRTIVGQEIIIRIVVQ
ncbi:MAG: hypothetical protein O8C58_01060 [Candidatus Methanoperedens sp.]|nr:hypothetical protein [Candidatus Methanoperedens sp.]